MNLCTTHAYRVRRDPASHAPSHGHHQAQRRRSTRPRTYSACPRCFAASSSTETRRIADRDRRVPPLVDDPLVAVRVEVARRARRCASWTAAVVAGEEARVGDGEPPDVGRGHAPPVRAAAGRAARSGRPSRRPATRSRPSARCATWSSCWRARCQTSQAMWLASPSGRQSSSSTESPSTTCGTPSRMRSKPSSRARGPCPSSRRPRPQHAPDRAGRSERAPGRRGLEPGCTGPGTNGPFAADVSEGARRSLNSRAHHTRRRRADRPITTQETRMTIDLTPTARLATSLAGLCDGAVHLPGDPGYDAARMPWNVALDQRPAAVALPRTVSDVQHVVRAAAAAGLRVAPQSTGHNAGPLVAQGLDDVVVVRTGACAASPSTRPAASPASRAARCGATRPSPPATTASPRCTAARPTSASPATASAAASAGTPASSASPPTASPRSSSSRPTASTCAPTRRRTPSSSGRCAAAAATSASSRPSSSASTRSRRRMPACSSGTATTPSACCAAGPSGRPEAPDDVTTSFRFLNLPPLPDDPGAAARPLARRHRRGGARLRRARRARSSACCAASARRSTPSAGCPPGRSTRLHMDPEGPTPGVSDGDAARRARRRGHRHVPRAGRARVDVVAARGRAAPARRGARPRARGPRCPRDDRRGIRRLRRGDRRDPGAGDAGAARRPPVHRARSSRGRRAAATSTSPRTRSTPGRATTSRPGCSSRGSARPYDPDDRFLANHRVPRLFEDGRVTA